MTPTPTHIDLTNTAGITDTAERWGVSRQRVQQYCSEGRVPGAVKITRDWLIPLSAGKPEKMAPGPKTSPEIPQKNTAKRGKSKGRKR